MVKNFQLSPYRAINKQKRPENIFLLNDGLSYIIMRFFLKLQGMFRAVIVHITKILQSLKIVIQ